jgi:hypothetical protein
MIHRITAVGIVLTFAVGMIVAVIMHYANVHDTSWARPTVVAASEIAREGAADCTSSLWGPTESDAADVASCVDDAIARAFGTQGTALPTR